MHVHEYMMYTCMLILSRKGERETERERGREKGERVERS